MAAGAVTECSLEATDLKCGWRRGRREPRPKKEENKIFSHFWTWGSVCFVFVFFLNRLAKIQFTCHIIHPFKVYNSIVFRTLIELCNQHHNHI